MITGRHCEACGEMRPDLRDDGIVQFLAELFESFTHVDGKLLRSMRALLARPGELTAAFMRGARRQYLTPIQMFLVANVVYFVMQSWLGWNTMSTPLYGQLNSTPYRDFARSHVESFAQTRGMTIDAIAAAFDARVETYAKSLVILLVPVFGIGVALVARSRSRGHLGSVVYALHFFAFYLWLLGLVLLPVANAFAKGWFGARDWRRVDDLMLVPTLGCVGIYLAVSLRTAFGGSAWSSIRRAAFLTLVFVGTIFLYRFVLFLVVLHTL